jgi:MinD-like ATPase involved in chromosome partitioning or flagellar assembly
MALIAIASDKGAPGVTTTALALAAVWPRPVLLAECDPAGGDLVYRFPAAGGGHLDPRRGVLSLAVVARRGMQPQQVWEHVQKLHGGLDVLAGVTNAEQGAGLSLLWGPIGKVLASLPQADVIADCGRLGADGPMYDLLAEATTVVLVTKVHVADVIRLRDRAAAFAAAAQARGRRGFGVGVVVIADHKKFRAELGEVQQVLGRAHAPATVVGGIAHDSKGADLLSGEWGGNLDRTLLIKTAREVTQHLLSSLPPIAAPAPASVVIPAPSQPPTPSPTLAPGSPLASNPAAFGGAPHPGPDSGPAASGEQAESSAGSPPGLPVASRPGPAGPPPEAVPAAGRGHRATFGRVLGGRSGKHQADSVQAAYVGAAGPSGPAQDVNPPRARHAQPPSRPAAPDFGPAAPDSRTAAPDSRTAAPDSGYVRTPMPPLPAADADPPAPELGYPLDQSRPGGG